SGWSGSVPITEDRQVRHRRWPGRLAATIVLAGCAGRSPAGTPVEPASAYDIVIRNGRVLDGAGNPWVRADIAIRGGIIARIGVVAGKGRREVDATGRYV